MIYLTVTEFILILAVAAVLVPLACAWSYKLGSQNSSAIACHKPLISFSTSPAKKTAPKVSSQARQLSVTSSEPLQ